MPKTEDGEFELILGNRQLLSVFFIVVVLLGVFFTMGYIVGRNSSPAVSADSGRKAEPKPIAVEPANQPSPLGAPATAPADSAASSPSAETPERTKAQPESAGAAKAAEPEHNPPKAETASPTPEEPVAGATYLQVAAVARAEAELFVDVLAKKGFHAIYTPVPNQVQLYRVLVGPYKDSSSVAQARTDLNSAGFKGFEALQRKY